MKTLKRTLCIVLVLAMAVGLFVISAGAKSLSDYSDASKVSEQFKAAVDANTQLGILKGMTESTYEPQGTLTRAQLATIIYRMVTGDTADKYVANYANAQRFSDVAPGAWYAGYVNYCADNGYLKGMGNGIYDPDGTLTGYQAMAALLRALGYDYNKEFEGKDWTVAVTKAANAKKINDGIIADWSKPISREIAAQLAFNTLVAQPVQWVAALGDYVDIPYNSTLAYLGYAPLIYKNFGVVYETIGTDADGNPSYRYNNAKGVAVVDIPLTPVKTYTTKVAVCDLLVDAGIPKTSTAPAKFAILQNGTIYESMTFTHKNLACEDEDDLHGQGVVTKLYDMSAFPNCDVDFVVAQTFYYLAQVTKVDKTAHGKTGETTLAVYCDGPGAEAREVVVPGASYAKGTWLIVHDIGEGYEFEDYYQYERPYLLKAAIGEDPEPVREAGDVWVIDYEAKTMTGKLEKAIENKKEGTIVYQINGKKENLNIDYYMSDANGDENFKGKNFTWFLDKYGNIIGDVEKIAPDSYVVVDRIAYKAQELEDGYAPARIVDMDAKKSQINITKVNGEAVENGDPAGIDYDAAPGGLSQQWQQNEDWEAPLYVINGTEITAVEDFAEGVSITKGIAKIETDDGNIYGNKNTVYLYRTGVRGNYQYASYKGVTKAPSVEEADIYYVTNDNNYITVIFVDVTSVGGGSSIKAIIPDGLDWTEKRVVESNDEKVEAYVYEIYDLEGKKIELLSTEELDLEAGLYKISLDADDLYKDAEALPGYADPVEIEADDTYDGEVFVDVSETDNNQYDFVDAKIIVVGETVEVLTAEEAAAVLVEGNSIVVLEAEYESQAYSVAYIFVAAE